MSVDPPVRMTLQTRVVLGRLAQRPDTPRSSHEIARSLALRPRTAAAIMRRLVGAKLAELHAGRYVLTSAGVELAAARGLVLAPAGRPRRMQHEPGS